MDIIITGRNIDLDKSTKAYINKKLSKLEKLYKRIYKCEVVLEEEKLRKNVEVILYLKRSKVVAKESSPDVYASIDLAADTVKKQLRRLHGKLSAKRKREVIDNIMGPMNFFGSSSSKKRSSREGDILSSNAFADKPMLPDEAKLELDLMDKNFIMFKNADTGKENVIYKRNDGNYGLIEPTF